MKRLATIGFIVVSLGVSTPVLAQENVGLLPTNPFYFLKEWGRSFRRAVTPSILKKVELGMQVREEKLAELKKMASIAADRVNSLVFTIDNYTDSVIRLTELFEAITDGAAAERILNLFVEQSVKHYAEIDALRIQLNDDESLQNDLANAQDALLDSLAQVVQRLDSPEKFAVRLHTALIQGEDPLKEIHAAEFLERLEQRLNTAFKKVVVQLQENLLLNLSGRLAGNMSLLGETFSVDGLGSAVSDPLLRLMVLDELRELVINSELKNQLSVLRQNILERTENDGGLIEEQVTAALKLLKNQLSEVEALVKEGAPAAQQLMNRVVFNIEQADELLSEGNVGGAFGQVTAGNAGIKGAFLYSTLTEKDFLSDEALLRSAYDELVKKIGNSDLLHQAEKEIIDVSKLINAGGSREKIINSLRSIKTLLATIEALGA